MNTIPECGTSGVLSWWLWLSHKWAHRSDRNKKAQRLMINQGFRRANIHDLNLATGVLLSPIRHHSKGTKKFQTWFNKRLALSKKFVVARESMDRKKTNLTITKKGKGVPKSRIMWPVWPWWRSASILFQNHRYFQDLCPQPSFSLSLYTLPSWI